MWPWGHLAAGYLCYSLYCRFVAGRAPRGVGTVAVLFGTQAPDLVDKPLAWTFGLLPSGRSLGHSLVVFALVAPLVWWVAGRRDHRPLAAAVGFGSLTHLLTDALYPILRFDFVGAGFLGWPLIPQPTYEGDYGVLTYFLELQPTPELAFEFVLVVVASVLWHFDGHPGLATVRSWPSRVVDATRS
jgi:hypothetical protein